MWFRWKLMKARFLFTKQIRSAENARDPVESGIYHLSPHQSLALLSLGRDALASWILLFFSLWEKEIVAFSTHWHEPYYDTTPFDGTYKINFYTYPHCLLRKKYFFKTSSYNLAPQLSLSKSGSSFLYYIFHS